MGRLMDNVRGNRAKELMEHISELFTKEEVIAMLTELQAKIEEIEIDNNVPFGFEPPSKTAAFYHGVSESSKVIQQKINVLKAEEGEK